MTLHFRRVEKMVIKRPCLRTYRSLKSLKQLKTTYFYFGKAQREILGRFKKMLAMGFLMTRPLALELGREYMVSAS